MSRRTLSLALILPGAVVWMTHGVVHGPPAARATGDLLEHCDLYPEYCYCSVNDCIGCYGLEYLSCGETLTVNFGRGQGLSNDRDLCTGDVIASREIIGHRILFSREQEVFISITPDVPQGVNLYLLSLCTYWGRCEDLFELSEEERTLTFRVPPNMGDKILNALYVESAKAEASGYEISMSCNEPTPVNEITWGTLKARYGL